MEKIKPKLSMILLYGMLISVVLILILFYAERYIITRAENPELYIFLIVVFNRGIVNNRVNQLEFTNFFTILFCHRN